MGSNSNFPKLPFTQPGTTSEWLLYDIKEAFCKLVDEINNITPSGFICTDLLDCTIFTDRVMPAGGTTGQVLTKQSDADYDAIWETPTGGSAAWGAITGTLSDQTDLAAVLAIKLETVTHDTTLTGAGTVASPLSVVGPVFVTAKVPLSAAQIATLNSVPVDVPEMPLAGTGYGWQIIIASMHLTFVSTEPSNVGFEIFIGTKINMTIINPVSPSDFFMKFQPTNYDIIDVLSENTKVSISASTDDVNGTDCTAIVYITAQKVKL